MKQNLLPWLLLTGSWCDSSSSRSLLSELSFVALKSGSRAAGKRKQRYTPDCGGQLVSPWGLLLLSWVGVGQGWGQEGNIAA